MLAFRREHARCTQHSARPRLSRMHLEAENATTAEAASLKTRPKRWTAIMLGPQAEHGTRTQ